MSDGVPTSLYLSSPDTSERPSPPLRRPVPRSQQRLGDEPKHVFPLIQSLSRRVIVENYPAVASSGHVRVDTFIVSSIRPSRSLHVF